MNKDSTALRFGPVTQTGLGPLYGQLIANIKRELRAGRLKPDEALPSTRALAAGLTVSVITVTRAYEELEREGLVYSRQGQGTFVSHSAEQKLAIERSAPWKALLTAVEAARKINMTDDDLFALLRAALNREGEKSR